jgi:hypothetical protein
MFASSVFLIVLFASTGERKISLEDISRAYAGHQVLADPRSGRWS